MKEHWKRFVAWWREPLVPALRLPDEPFLPDLNLHPVEPFNRIMREQIMSHPNPAEAQRKVKAELERIRQQQQQK